METRKLSKVFEGKGSVKGITFSQVDESDATYVYYRNDGYYEVFLKKTTPICIDFEKRIYSETELKELYPKDKDFGSWGWCFKDKNKAWKHQVKLEVQQWSKQEEVMRTRVKNE